MRHFKKVSLLLVLFILVIGYATIIWAACDADSDCKNGRICRNGVCVSSANAGCTKDSDCPGDLVCEKGKCANSSDGTSDLKSNDTFYQQRQFIPATFCCDSFGNRRCPLINQVPEGATCFCTGQGWGIACR